ncbi:hypothetical protein EJ06DRAFT_7954 [Trichodelitschia bisporula]|uniref:Uncharacterized protein n=1 Tax=Trichodelitschia bisporula TaxID=703511 RepID=A0A6G1IA66_9PEZI|nr:hypothetical protein EJ06DRAFT_7954 [Trichodelitschia bisporula]
MRSWKAGWHEHRIVKLPLRASRLRPSTPVTLFSLPSTTRLRYPATTTAHLPSQLITFLTPNPTLRCHAALPPALPLPEHAEPGPRKPRSIRARWAIWTGHRVISSPRAPIGGGRRHCVSAIKHARDSIQYCRRISPAPTDSIQPFKVKTQPRVLCDCAAASHSARVEQACPPDAILVEESFARC